MRTKWGILLLLLIILDVFVTLYIGVETNHLILWTMNFLSISLKQAMMLKFIISIPCIMFLDKHCYAKFTFFAYIIIYILLVAFDISVKTFL